VSIPSCLFHPNAKSPDVPGAVDIATECSIVSPAWDQDREEMISENVWPGLVPAIHVLARKKDVDGLHKAGHDG
jgi:hypothetical protein